MLITLPQNIIKQTRNRHLIAWLLIIAYYAIYSSIEGDFLVKSVWISLLIINYTFSYYTLVIIIWPMVLGQKKILFSFFIILLIAFFCSFFYIQANVIIPSIGDYMDYAPYSSKDFENRYYPNANIFFLKVSNSEKETIKNSLIGMKGQVDHYSAPNYYLLGTNCTTQACQALNAANLSFKGYSDFDGTVFNLGKINYVIPNSFNRFMKDQYENRDIGSPVKAWLDRGNYFGPTSNILHN